MIRKLAHFYTYFFYSSENITLALRTDGLVVGLLRVRPDLVPGLLEGEYADAVPPW